MDGDCSCGVTHRQSSAVSRAQILATYDYVDDGDPSVRLTEFVERRDEATSPPLVSAEQGSLLPAAGAALLGAKTGDGKTTSRLGTGSLFEQFIVVGDGLPVSRGSASKLDVA
jgi:hypothetical protein